MIPHAWMVCIGAALLAALPADARAQERDLNGLQPLAARVHVTSARIAGDTTSITYVVENTRPGSEDLWGLMVAMPGAVVRMPAPARLQWMMASRYRGRPIAQWMLYGERVHAGQVSPELAIVARGLPDLVRYWAVPDLRAHPPDYSDDEHEKSFIDYSDSGTTVGIVPVPAGASAASLTARLHALLGRACGGLGWVTQQGVCHSLDVKLVHAQEALTAGQATTARNELTAFLHELDAQHGAQPGKHVTDDGYALLAVNARYLLDRL